MRALLLLICVCLNFVTAAQQVYEVKNGTVRFNSEAPQELIHASSDQLAGIIDPVKKTFAFRVSIASFMGFNSPLQREHFNENYMESSLYPEAFFRGKIIEDVDLTADGEYHVRTKGKLKIHGLEQERIIRAIVTTRDGKMSVRSDFEVFLADYNIKIPRVVNEKLSPKIDVSVTATLAPRN